MIFFSKKNKCSHKKLQTVANKVNGWYAGADYNLQLSRELDRSSRSGLPMSQVHIELSNRRRHSDLLDKNAYNSFLCKLIKLINDNTRISDIKFLKDDRSKITILLLDTTIEGAKAFSEKLLGKLMVGFQGPLYLGYVHLIESLAISVHPYQMVREKAQIRHSPVVLGEPESPAAWEIDDSSEADSAHLNGHPGGFSTEKNASRAFKFEVAPRSVEHVSQTVYRFLKRAADVLGALIGIVLFLPFFLLIPLVIKATSKGPVLFKQTRIGFGGKPFTFLKFRTMMTDSDDQIHREYIKSFIRGRDEEINKGSETNPVYKLTNDPRITKIGSFLRKTSLDELPQFFNVLAGSMSLVGPRPPIPYEIEFYQNWHLRRVMDTKPGITGLWQIQGRNKTTFDEMVRLDLQYVRKRSIYLDFKIMLKTVAVFFNTKAGI